MALALAMTLCSYLLLNRSGEVQYRTILVKNDASCKQQKQLKTWVLYQKTLRRRVEHSEEHASMLAKVNGSNTNASRQLPKGYQQSLRQTK